MAKVFIGQIVNTKSLNDFEIITNGYLAVDANGKIIEIGNNYAQWQQKNLINFQEIQMSSSQFLMPGFVDCHIHAPQFPQLGLGMNIPLLDWLNSYTFPLESNYQDEQFAAMVYKKVVTTTIRNGTTLASYFATNHKNSSVILAKQAIVQGQRAFIGKVCSNCNSPDFYVETLEESINETIRFVEEIESLQNDLVKPIITPRFAISCTKQLMESLAKLATKHNLNIQTHISENINEIEFVKKLFGKSYAEVYDDCRLLTNKTILAHAVHLEDSEIKLLKDKNSSIAHCPSSNNNLCSGLCDVKKLIQNGLKVGLGTDVAGGNRASIHDSLLRCMDVSHQISFIKNQCIQSIRPNEQNQNLSDYIPLDYKQAIYLATLGGAEALSMDTITGNFICNKDFDALLIDIDLFPINNIEIPNKVNDKTSLLHRICEENVQKFIYCGDDRNIVKVFVKGKQIK